MDCGNGISFMSALYGKGRCLSCSNIEKHKQGLYPARWQGKNNPMYVDGCSTIIRYCMDCGTKVSRNSKARCDSCNIKNRTGTKHPCYINGKRKCVDCGKKLSDYKSQRCTVCYHKTQIKIKITYCCMGCGDKICMQTALYGDGRCKKCSKIGSLHARLGIKLSKKTKGKISKALFGRFTGQDSPHYVHGQGNFPYPSKFSNKLKTKIRKRDNNKCQKCGKLEKDHFRKLDVHHIDYNKFNCDEMNLISLCTGCHTRTNKNRDYWYSFYTYIMEDK